MPVFSFSSVTLAPCTTAADGSVIWPTITPRVAWAHTGPVIDISKKPDQIMAVRNVFSRRISASLLFRDNPADVGLERVINVDQQASFIYALFNGVLSYADIRVSL